MNGADTVIPFNKGNYTLSIPIYYYGQTRSTYGGSYTKFAFNATIVVKITDGVATITSGASGYNEHDVGSNMIGGRGYSISAITVTEN